MATGWTEGLGKISLDADLLIQRLRVHIQEAPKVKWDEPAPSAEPFYSREDILMMNMAIDSLKITQRLLWFVIGDP